MRTELASAAILRAHYCLNPLRITGEKDIKESFASSPLSVVCLDIREQTTVGRDRASVSYLSSQSLGGVSIGLDLYRGWQVHGSIDSP